MATYYFQQEKLYASKSGVCPVCGKRATRSEKFTQTVNPWNTNKDGKVKTSAEIRVQLKQSADEWRAQPVLHAKCESF